MAARDCTALLFAALVPACAMAPYAPCPVDVPAPLPADAFARCREVILRNYSGLVVADAVGFRLQTDWTPVADPQGERRATLYRETGTTDGGLVVVVELRWLSAPWFGTPNWTEPHGDAAAERELAQQLQ